MGERHLERCEVLTPLGTPAATSLMRSSGERDHVAEVLDDGTHVLVTPIVLPIRVVSVRPVAAELEKGRGDE